MRLFVAQGLAEYGALASKSAGASGSGAGIIETARYRLESYIGQGNAPWFLGALLVLVLLVMMVRAKRDQY